MNKTRWIAICLVLLLCLGGCAPQQEEDITANTNSMQQQSGTDQQTPPSSLPETESNESPENPESTPQSPQTTPQQGGSSGQKPVENDSKQDTPQKDLSIVDLDTDVRYFGRVYQQNGTYYCNWTCSGFEFTFNGTGAEATFETAYLNEADIPYIKIYVDGKEKQSVAVTDSMQTITLCKGLKKGTHTVRVVKRTNARSSPLGLMDITLAKGGTIQTPPVAKQRRIEFVGDSLTVGYGTIADSSTTEWSTATEDGTLTYAAFAAQALQAEYNVVAISGRGLAHNTTGDTDKLMPALYTKVDEYNYAGHDWNFSSFQPHVVVINLGANDHGTSSPGEVTTATTAFLKTVRKNNPGAYIVVAYGMTGNGLESALKNAIAATGDGKISYLPLKETVGKVLWHPDQNSHKENGELLRQHISKLTGWK